MNPLKRAQELLDATPVLGNVRRFNQKLFKTKNQGLLDLALSIGTHGGARRSGFLSRLLGRVNNKGELVRNVPGTRVLVPKGQELRFVRQERMVPLPTELLR